MTRYVVLGVGMVIMGTFVADLAALRPSFLLDLGLIGLLPAVGAAACLGVERSVAKALVIWGTSAMLSVVVVGVIRVYVMKY